MEVLYFLAVSAIVLGAINPGRAQSGSPQSGKPYCRFGYEGDCGPYNNFRCPAGTRCRQTLFSEIGLCCYVSPQPTGVCPPPSGRMGICVFDPTRNCLADSECPRDHMCCSEGCGKVCKHRRTGAVYPKPLPGTAM